MRLLLALGIGYAHAAGSCQVCTASKDYKGDFVGAGDEACWNEKEAVTGYETECEGESMCTTELVVDWLPRGGHQYILKRLCAPLTQSYPEGKCDERSSTSLQFKDCLITCDRDNCNTDFDSVASLFDAGPTAVSSCYECGYYQTSDGKVQGQPACLEDIPPSNPNNITRVECPKYANAGCSSAASAHKSYGGSEAPEYMQEEYRSCSPFADVNVCYDTQINDLDHESCKSTCKTNNCNIFKHQMRHQCYTCSSVRGTSGLPLGTGDERCWDETLIDNTMLADCNYDEQYCGVEVTVQYMGLGNQEATITRGCRQKAVNEKEEYCEEVENEISGFMFKDCVKLCENKDGECNKDMGHEELWGGAQDTCYSCYDMDRLDGSVSGNVDCIQNPGDITNGVSECPYWAKAGCYQTISSHFIGTDAENHEDAYRGCSAFHMKKFQEDPTDNFQCHTWNTNVPDIGPVAYNTCKKTCQGNNCNDEYENPLVNGTLAACLVCTVTVDDRNNTVGIGDRRCWEGEDMRNLIQVCPENQQHCITDMEVDWLPRGEVQYRVRRGCSAKPAPTNCFEGNSNLIQYKDCQESCDTGTGVQNGCNTGLDSISQRFAPDGPSVTECKSCSYFQKEDGTVQGNINCKENPDMVGTTYCPLYASAACYEASSFHQSYASSGVQQVEDDYRGCSTFELPVEDEENETAANCAVSEINGLAHQNCKRTCNKDGCNVHRLQNRHTCFQCTGTRNAQGMPIGVGDDRCFEHPSENSLIDCDLGEDYCIDELIIDWLPRGDQVARIVRGCSKVPQDTCSGSDLPMTAYKDCFLSCVGDKCNNNFEVAKKFLPNDRKTFECQACEYIQYDDGEESGNTNCQGPTGPEHANNYNMTCPDYAQYGCFTAASVHVSAVDQKDKVEIYKGCSTFPISGNGIKQYEYQSPDGGDYFSVAKTFCTEDYNDEASYNGCNKEVLLPDAIEDNKAIECYQCQVSVDQRNQTLGTGERSCWDNPQERHLQKCSIGQTCAVDMEIDWMSRGMMMYRITRGCSDRKVEDPEPVCKEGATSLAQFKDCDVVCNEDGCNKGLDEVSARFNDGSVTECYSCEYSEGKDGSVSGAPFCGDSIDIEANATRVPIRTCPAYANKACYQASSLHEDYSNSDVDFEEDYRGCSTFDHANGEDFTCQSTSIDQISHLNCKSSCKENNCNTRGLTAGNTCASCKITYDSLYRPIGVGDIDCWFDVKDRHAVVCGEDQPYCTTELKVDWIGRGSQIYELSRGCSSTKPLEACTETSSKAVKTKDCFYHCENGQVQGGKDFCNNDIWSVAKLFRPEPENPLEGYYQPGCFGCVYIEKDDGTVEGNKHCYDPSLPDGPPIAYGPCPVHASVGCYTGSSKHLSPSGEEVNEVWKGCSVFQLDAVEKEQIELPVSGGLTSMHSTVKETCQGQGCNAPTDKPDDFTTTTKEMSTSSSKPVVSSTTASGGAETTSTSTTTSTTAATADASHLLASLALLALSMML